MKKTPKTGAIVALRGLALNESKSWPIREYYRLASPMRRVRLEEGKRFSMRSDNEAGTVTVTRIA